MRTLRDSDLVAAGEPTDVAVLDAAADSTAPVLTAFSIAPDTVHLNADLHQITFTASVEDVGSGVGYVLAFAGPRGADGGSGCGLQRVSGTAAEGTYSCAMVLPDTAILGEWDAEVSLRDVTGNDREYGLPQLDSAGFKRSVIVQR
ncbi:MAG TPA: hypothetical protein VFW98_03085 [Gemmatimonadaceae bacterium]|nr:hypothetical protein [Gemmatimonadaceae bacterium]